MIINIWVQQVEEEAMDLKKIPLINLKMIYIKIRVEYIIKLILLVQLEEEKVMIFPNKL
jgi:hypothetical protein